MRKALFTIYAIFLVSSFCLAQMKLQLPYEITGEKTQTIINNDLDSYLNLGLPQEATASTDMKDFVKGMFLLGLLADVSIPFGDEKSVQEPGFKHIAGTGWSGHAVVSYVVAASWMLSLRGGYISFGTQTSEEVNESFKLKNEDCFSIIPILFDVKYLFATGSGFKPYLGLALGIFIQNYNYTGTIAYEGLQEVPFGKIDKSSTGFGIVPAVGFYYLLGSVALHMAVEYNYVFSELKVTPDDIQLPGLLKSGSSAGITQELLSESYTANYLSILLGLSFTIGGN